MWRSKSGLQWPQSRFLRALLKGKWSVGQILKRQQIPLTRLNKWIREDAALAEELKRARLMVEMIREMNLEIGALAAVRLLNSSLFKDVLSDRQLKAGTVLVRAPRKLEGRGKEKKGEADEERVVSEREWVRSMSGEEGVKAYDELVEMRKARWAREKAEREAREREGDGTPDKAGS